MNQRFGFTFDFIKSEFEKIQQLGYQVVTCADYVTIKQKEYAKILVNRVDIDLSVRKTAALLDIFKSLEIKATFFIRLHAPEYNPFSFENYRILRRIIDEGHELGYHSEVVDQGAIWNEDETECLVRDLEILERMFNTKVRGVASHGGMTGLNNLDFWKGRNPNEFGLLYEAYDTNSSFNLFNESFYVSDSEWIQWKAYLKGDLVVGDKRSPSEHAMASHNLIYLLIHPDTYYVNNIYE